MEYCAASKEFSKDSVMGRMFAYTRRCAEDPLSSNGEGLLGQFPAGRVRRYILDATVGCPRRSPVSGEP
jgi:hypothetical protein